MKTPLIDEFLAEVERCLDGTPAEKADAISLLRIYLDTAEHEGTVVATLASLGSPQELVAKMRARGATHRHLDAVALPDGTRIWAASFRTHYERDRPPDFGLYLDYRWQPPWPHEHVDWPDFGVPPDTSALVATLMAALERARNGEIVEVGCLGGHGRTGTALACLSVLCGLETDPVEWVRSVYCERAVETDAQVALVGAFSRLFNG